MDSNFLALSHQNAAGDKDLWCNEVKLTSDLLNGHELIDRYLFLLLLRHDQFYLYSSINVLAFLTVFYYWLN